MVPQTALTDTERRLLSQPASRRAAALIEVLLSFALVHLCWRSFKHFTWLGRLESTAHQNYSAGIVMILFTVLAVRLRGWRLSDFGMNLKNWRYNLNLGILWGLLSPVALLLVIGLSGYRPKVDGNQQTPWNVAFIGCGVALAYWLLLLWILRTPRAALVAVPPAAGVVALVVFCSLPVLVAFHFHRPVPHMVGIVGWMFLGAGFGEEIFFRGYIQTRLDLAFGRPIVFAGLRFGAGLIVSSMLFGLVHALNPVDYFHGRFAFNWPLGLVESFEGVLFATIRQKTGSIFPGAIAHGLADVLKRIPG